MSESEEENKKSQGIILKESREAQKFSLEEVHESTKIPLDVLRSMEEGYTVRNISAFYLKGFMKMYAKHLGIDVREVLADYHEEKLPEHKGEKVQLMAPMSGLGNFFTQQRQRQMITVVLIMSGLWGAVRIIGCVRQKVYNAPGERKIGAGRASRPAGKLSRAEEKKRLARKRVLISSGRKTSSAKEKKNNVPQAIASSAAGGAASEGSVKGQVTVTVKARKTAWLQVRTDGNIVFQSTLKQGVSETWHANKAVELSGKNIYYLDFEINGKILGNLGRADRNVRRVTVTKRGLTVRR